MHYMPRVTMSPTGAQTQIVYNSTLTCQPPPHLYHLILSYCLRLLWEKEHHIAFAHVVKMRRDISLLQSVVDFRFT